MFDSLDKFLDHLEFVKNYSFNTIKSYELDIRRFEAFLSENKTSLKKADKMLIRRYLHELTAIHKLSARSVSRAISANRSYWDFLNSNNIVKQNPWAKIANPKLPSKVLEVASYEEIDKLLNTIEDESVLGLRDRTIFELLYATGMRINELTSLNIADVDIDMQEIIVFGKGSKERIVIVGGAALRYLERYLQQGRQNLLGNGNTKALFLNKFGSRISPRSLERKLEKYVGGAGLDRVITPHSLRHAFASHLLQNGADLRTVQELLGHVSLSTTQIYTHLNKEQIKNTFQKFHPRK